MDARTPQEFEERLARFLYERAEEARAVRVGEKETSEQAAIVARYEDLFTREQYEVLHEAEGIADGDEHERLFRLREACGGGVIVRELAEEADLLENDLLACRVTFRGEELPLRTAQAQLAVLDDYSDRGELGTLAADSSAGFNERRRALMRRAEERAARFDGARRRRGSICGSSRPRFRRPHAARPTRSPRSASVGRTASSGPSARTSPRPTTSRTSDACRRSPARTRRSGRCRSASRRSIGSGSTSPPSRASSSTSTTVLRRTRAPASSPPTHRRSST